MKENPRQIGLKEMYCSLQDWLSLGVSYSIFYGHKHAGIPKCVFFFFFWKLPNVYAKFLFFFQQPEKAKISLKTKEEHQQRTKNTKE